MQAFLFHILAISSSRAVPRVVVELSTSTCSFPPYSTTWVWFELVGALSQETTQIVEEDLSSSDLALVSCSTDAILHHRLTKITSLRLDTGDAV